MNTYNPALEEVVDGIDFGPSHPCTWVVYPPGCAGDLLASIINFHYVETGSRYKGITSDGKVIFRSSDMKISNLRMQDNVLKFDNQFFYDLADSLATRYLNWSKMDHFIFANHCYTDQYVQTILDAFTNCKIIQLLPRTVGELAIIKWLSRFKNTPQGATPFVLPNNANETLTHWTQWTDPRVLTVFFGDLVNRNQFQSLYQDIQQHQKFAGPMITYDFVQFWISRQHPEIQEHINRLARD